METPLIVPPVNAIALEATPAVNTCALMLEIVGAVFVAVGGVTGGVLVVEPLSTINAPKSGNDVGSFWKLIPAGAATE